MIRVGMSGWTFEAWRKDFYPKGLVQRKELEYASRKVNSIEINGTFYSLQKPPSFQKWYAETPEDFCFAVKAPQFITHIRRLKEVDEPLANFFASGIFCLKEKLGPILWQLPPNLTLKDDRVEKFLELLPYDAKSAMKLAKKHSSKMDGRNETKFNAEVPIRHALEVRHSSFQDEKFLKLLKTHNVAIVFAHTGVPYIEEVTADFIYARMHGKGPDYEKGYPKERLKWWADRVKGWTGGKGSANRDAYIYFDTEEKIYAPFDAMNFANLLR